MYRSRKHCSHLWAILKRRGTIDYDPRYLENAIGCNGYKAAAADRDRRPPVIRHSRGTGGLIQDTLLAETAEARGGRRNPGISSEDRSEETRARVVCIRACHHQRIEV